MRLLTLSERKKEKRARSPMTERTAAGEHRLLTQTDIEHGMEMLKINNEKIARKASYESPLENGQYMITQPRSDDSGDTVTTV